MTPDRRKNQALAFEDCLEQLQQGDQSLEQTLGKYPQYSETLKSDLETARWLVDRRPELAPRPAFVSASRRRLLARIEAQDAPARAPSLRWAFASLRFPSIWRQYAPRVVLVYLLLVTLLFSAGRVSSASLTWLPGDLGYPLKIAMESMAVIASPTAAGDARLHIQFAHRRLIEAQSLVLEGRYEQIPATVANFSGHVEGAVRSVTRVARHDHTQANHLALDLQRVLSNQTSLVVVLSGLTPEVARADFQRVLIIAENGVSAIRELLDPGDSGASSNGVTYRIVRQYLAG